MEQKKRNQSSLPMVYLSISPLIFSFSSSREENSSSKSIFCALTSSNWESFNLTSSSSLSISSLCCCCRTLNSKFLLGDQRHSYTLNNHTLVKNFSIHRNINILHCMFLPFNLLDSLPNTALSEQVQA